MKPVLASAPPQNQSYERRYRLAARLELAVSEIGGVQTGLIYCRYPLYVTRTTPAIIALLQKCDGERSLAQIARELGKKPASLLPALEGLQRKGIVELAGAEARPEALAEANLPSVSFIVPVRNRPALLRRCLQSIFDLDYPPEKCEVIVVDDGSTDNTAEVASAFDVKLLRNEQQIGAGRSRNRAVSQAQNELLALIDSDCIVEQDWLRRLVPFFNDPAQAVVGGAIRAANTGPLIGRYEDVKSSLFTGERPAEVTLNGEVDQLPAANLLIRRAAFEEINGHDPGLIFGEDVDLCWRLIKAGGRVSYRPVAGVKHAYRLTLKGFLKTRFGYATGEAHLQARHREKRRVFILPKRAAFGWLGVLGWLAMPGKGWPLLLLAAGPLLWQSRKKWQELQPYRLPLTSKDVLAAEGRSFIAAGFHLSKHLGRYYSLPLLALTLLNPQRAALPVVLTLLGPAWGDYVRLKPRMNFPAFAALFLLENAFYQAGLIEGCRQARSLRALVPEIRLER